MPIDSETIKLILDLANSSKDVTALTDHLKALNLTTKTVAEAYEVLDKTTGTYALTTNKLEKEMDDLVRKSLEQTQAQKAMGTIMDELATSTIHAGAAATQAVGSKTAGGRGMLGFSYAVQDFTSVLTMGGNPLDALPRAMGSIANNIDQMGMAAGMSAAKAASLSLGFTGLVVALPGLIGLFKDLWLWMGAGPKGPEPVLDAFDKVADRLKTIKADLEGIMKSKTTQEKETEGLRKEYFAEAGGDQFIDQLTAAIGVSGKGEQPTAGEEFSVTDLQRRINDAKKAGFRTGIEEDLLLNIQRAIRKRITEANRQRAGRLAGEAAGVGPGARAAQQMIGGFMPGVGADLAGLEPEARAQQDEEVERVEQEGKKRHEAGEKRREALRAKNKEVQDEISRRERMGTEAQTEHNKHLGDSVKLGRDVGKAFEKKDEESRTKPARLKPIPLMPLNPADIQADQVAAHTQSIMAENQMLLTRKLQALEQANRNAKRVNSQLVTTTESPLPK